MKDNDFWRNKYFRLSKRLVSDPFFWDRSHESRLIFLLIGIKCSAIVGKNTCLIGYRLISQICRLPKNNINDYLWELIDHDKALIKIIKPNIGSRPFRYALTGYAVADFNKDSYFPFYGYLFFNSEWLSLTNLERDLFLMIGGMSFQEKSTPMPLNCPSTRYCNILDLEMAVDSYELVRNEDEYFINIDKVLERLEKVGLIQIKNCLIKIPMLG